MRKEFNGHLEYIEKLKYHCEMREKGVFFRLTRRPVRIATSKLFEIYANRLGTVSSMRAKLFWGEHMNVVFPDCVSTSLYRDGFIEEGLTRIVLDLVRDGMCFFDVGAHYGYYTLLASDLVGSTGDVHAFEPISHTFTVLRSNVSDHKNVSLNKKALYSDDGLTLQMNNYGIKHSGFNSTGPEELAFDPDRIPAEFGSGLQATKTEPSETVTLDTYVEKKDLKPDFIKIDAEACEKDILMGSQGVLEKIRPMVSLEVGDFNVARESSREMVKFMLDRGYRAYEYGSFQNPLRDHDIQKTYFHQNLIFLPE